MRISKPAWWHAGGQSHRLIAPIILLTLATVGTLVYLLPGDTSGSDRAAAAAPSAGPSATAALPSFGSPTATASTPSKPAAASASRPAGSSRAATVPVPGQVIHQVTTRYLPGRARTVTATAAPKDKSQHCWDFTWQQDAQTAYVANLSDPWGLDGAPGPQNGDGLACTNLPVDPSRAKSKPVGAYTPPAADIAGKADLVKPDADYFGVTEDGLPNATTQLDRIDRQLGKAPSSIGFFAYWDAAFPASKVSSAWQRGALPVMTWMSMPSDGTSAASYSMTRILAGDWDDYLYRFAGDIVRTNLPVVIRFDHEMNGNWFPWSAGHDDWNNSPAKYVAVWRHVWSIFQQVGANADVIWLYSPARVDNIKGLSHTSAIADDYPGDDYVDWVGATVYWRKSSQPTDYESNFGATVGQLRAVTAKPLFFAEVGARQTQDGADLSGAKQQWITNTLNGFLADPSVVGFDWFNNVATTPDDTESHDWRFNATPSTLATFKRLITDARFSGGVMPDK
jgi:hypothetical protein